MGSKKSSGLILIGSNSLMLFLVILLKSTSLGGIGDGKYIVTGRVIDEYGKKVQDARVFLRHSKVEEGSVDNLVVFGKTDSQGIFYLESVATKENAELKLIITAPLPPATFECIPPPFDDLMTSDILFTGVPLFVSSGQQLNLGDMRVQISYSAIEIHIQHSSGKPLLDQLEQWKGVKLRVRDKSGDVIRERYVVSEERANSYIQLNRSVINVALPTGKWMIEIGLPREQNRWLAMEHPLNITPARKKTIYRMIDNPSSLNKKSKYISNILTKIKNSTAARQELDRLKITYSEDSFVERAAKGNYKAITLFLLAGMAAGTKNNNGTPVLVAAAKYPDILQYLLAAGANANIKDNDGVTAIMIASSLGIIPSMKLLHSNGALINEMTANGTTALLLAVAGNHYRSIETLLSWGADVSAKNDTGVNALKLAELIGSEDIINLVRSAGTRKNR